MSQFSNTMSFSLFSEFEVSIGSNNLFYILSQSLSDLKVYEASVTNLQLVSNSSLLTSYDLGSPGSNIELKEMSPNQFYAENSAGQYVFETEPSFLILPLDDKGYTIRSLMAIDPSEYLYRAAVLGFGQSRQFEVRYDGYQGQ